MDKKICCHNDIEKINNNIYICKDCSLIRKINLEKNNENNASIKLLLSKQNYYNIKNEINIFYLTKNAIKFHDDLLNNNNINDIFIKNSSLYLKFRAKLVKHIHNLCSEINSTYECYYLSILLLDIIIHKLNYIITNYQLDLFSTTCFIISKKFIEKDSMKVEKYNQYLTICHSPQKFINSKDIILSEIECLKILKYQLNIPSSFTIMKYFFICGIIFENEIDINEFSYSNIYDECLKLLSFCNDSNEIAFYYNPVLIVFSVIYLIRKKYRLKILDTMDLFSLFNIKFSNIKQCVKLISDLYFNKNNIKSNINLDKHIRKSYSQNKKNSIKTEKGFYTPRNYVNFNLNNNSYYIMTVKEYKIEKNNWIKDDKDDKCFFRCFNRKRKLYEINIQDPCYYTNNFNHSTHGNVKLDGSNYIFRNI